MFDALPDVVCTKAELPKAADMLRPRLQKDYDVIVMYDMVPGCTPEQQKSFIELLNQGIDLVSLHHNLCAHDAWSEYREIIGGKYLLKETTIDGKKCGPSDYSDDQDMAVAVADRQHPITAGIADFKIHDEAEANAMVNRT